MGKNEKIEEEIHEKKLSDRQFRFNKNLEKLHRVDNYLQTLQNIANFRSFFIIILIFKKYYFVKIIKNYLKTSKKIF